MRVIEPDPKQLALALQFLPELVIRHLHEVLVAPLAQGAFPLCPFNPAKIKIIVWYFGKKFAK